VLILQEKRRGVVFEILLQPRASRNEIAGVHGDCLKVRVTAPPVEGKANQACIDCIAHALGLKRSEVEILSGHTARRKRLHVSGITPEEFKRRLNHLIE
jgi:uncharacterized protein (TIGR00251 family)